MPNTMRDVRSHTHGPVPASWPSAGIVDARTFRVGNGTAVHALTHASANMVRGACGVVARVVETDGPRATSANSLPTCKTCQSA